MLPGCCPVCQAKAPLDAFISDAKYRQAMLPIAELPSQLAGVLVPYLGLFAPTSGRALRADKLERIVRELVTLVKSGEVTRNRITLGAPLDYWRMAIEAALDARGENRLELPLDDHNYIAAIVWRTSNKAAERYEIKKEEGLRHPQARPSSGAGLQPVGKKTGWGDVDPKAQAEKLKQARNKVGV